MSDLEKRDDLLRELEIQSILEESHDLADIEQMKLNAEKYRAKRRNSQRSRVAFAVEGNLLHRYRLGIRVALSAEFRRIGAKHRYIFPAARHTHPITLISVG